MSPRTTWIASTGLALVLAGALAWLANRPATADCSAEAPATHEIRATKVVVQPWLGPHHVYGVFMVPDRHVARKNYVVTMTVRGFDRRFTVHGRDDERHVDEAPAGSGHSFLRSNLPTRVALWFLLNGKFGDLRHPCNWMLAFIERAR